MLSNILTLFELNDRERKVFTKLMEIGGQPASQIARFLELPRNTTRDILDRLVKKGLLTCSQKANTHYYTLETPQNILRHLEIQKKKTISHLDSQIDFIKKYGEELHPHMYSPTRPRVTFYEGEDGLRRVYEDTLSSKEPIRAYASLETMYASLPGYFPEYFKRRAKKKIPIRAIFPDCPEARDRKKEDEKELRESTLVPQKNYDLTPEINIYDNKFIMVSWKEKLAVMVESKEISQAMKVIFELAWGQAKRLETTIESSPKARSNKSAPRRATL